MRTNLFLKEFIYLLLERGEGRKKQRERNIHVWGKYQLVASHTPRLRIGPATQACVLTGSRTSNLLVQRPALNPLSHTSQGPWKWILVHVFVRFNILIKSQIRKNPKSHYLLGNEVTNEVHGVEEVPAPCRDMKNERFFSSCRSQSLVGKACVFAVRILTLPLTSFVTLSKVCERSQS